MYILNLKIFSKMISFWKKHNKGRNFNTFYIKCDIVYKFYIFTMLFEKEKWIYVF